RTCTVIQVASFEGMDTIVVEGIKNDKDKVVRLKFNGEDRGRAEALAKEPDEKKKEVELEKS
ncbi:MAG: hypothetical protein AAFN70_06205, partial [Planctomycetota bacterium]